MRHLLAALALAAFSIVAVIGAEEAPIQFQVWGSHGHGFPPVPEGFSEVRAEPRVRSAPEATALETATGFTVFQRRPFECIYHDSVPAAFERDDKLQAFATQGEYEPLSFAIYPRKELKALRVLVAELKNKQGATIPASHIDLRVVRTIRTQVGKEKHYTQTPFYLEKFEQLDLQPGQTTQLWLTLKVPEQAPAGDYQGQLDLQLAGKSVRQLPLLVKVLPFRLPPIAVETTMSHKPAADPALLEKDLIDQREHGITNPEMGLGAHIVSRDKKFGEDDIAATRQSIQRAVAMRKKVFGDKANRFPVTAEVGHQVLFYWDQKKNWFEFWPESPELTADFFKAIQVVEETLKAESVPWRLFIMDEPGGHPDLLKGTVRYNQLAKEKLPHLQSLVTIGGGIGIGIDEIAQLGPSVEMLTCNRFDPDLCRTFVERKQPYGIYNGGGATEAVSGFTRDRHFFGFYFFKSGASEILQWIYRFGDAWKEPLRGNHGYAYAGVGGPLPSIPWEGVREGLDDFRYMDLLWRLIAAARQGGQTQAAQAGERAALEVLGAFGFDFQKRTGGTTTPVAALQDKWRWKVAAACLELLKVVPIEKALATPPQRLAPLELPAPKEEAALKYGPELLPDSSFENGAAPWKASGKGQGELDTTLAHGGKSSFRIESKPGAAGTDVQVLVWGWGGPGPAMTFTTGKTYEFSTWLKSEGAMPSLRISLPQGSVLRESAGHAETEGPWKRLWMRVTLKKDAKPGYLAVWLQGPGKLWCDDLSVREVLLPAFQLELTQTLVDSSDRNLLLRLKQSGHSELSVALQLPRGQTQTVKIPPQAETLVDFDPQPLPPGSYEFKAQLAGADEPSVQTLAIQKVRSPFE